ncbi:hypothetical protein L596_002553 [Steinernema carpocapsae]|uniref:Uncharacterized protein n=1 Tax=Steinernema carpocapsae TaxID=34508 RepID=A0A4V6I7S0_STECR|nr:hypothetical protein L596_002553 [Steinernema carpocapsae]
MLQRVCARWDWNRTNLENLAGILSPNSLKLVLYECSKVAFSPCVNRPLFRELFLFFWCFCRAWTNDGCSKGYMVRISRRSVAAKEALETRRKEALKENVELRAEVDRLKGRVNDMTSLVDALKHALKHQKMKNNSRKWTNLSEFGLKMLARCSSFVLSVYRRAHTR